MTDDETEEREYEVGYSKPPEAHRFRKGWSGNPKGRPKGSRNIKAVLDEMLNKKQSIRENGKVKQCTTFEVVLLQLVAKASKGDLKATAQLLSLYERHNLVDGNVDRLSTIDADDRALIDTFLARMSANDEGANG